MRRILSVATAVTLLGLFLNTNSGRGQEEKKVLLPTTGWGSLTGKVTLGKDSKFPAVLDLVPAMKAKDPACCLAAAAKPGEKVDQTWIVDAKTRAIANVVVWIKAPMGNYFPIADQFKKRKDAVVIDQPHCAFLPRVSAINPSYYDGAKDVPTGQPVVIKNSAVCPHNIRALGHPDRNPGFNKTLPPKTELEVTDTFKPQLLPISMMCDIHPWMAAKLFVFDHPYYAITKEDGSFEIPVLPAGAEVTIMGWHEGKGWTLPGGKMGQKMMIKAGKNTFDFSFDPPS
jgi:hypothetical protein